MTIATQKSWYQRNRPRLLAHYARVRAQQRAVAAYMRARGWRQSGGLWVPRR
jgi:hypothetical protein